MVCERCIRIVREDLEGTGATIKDIKLGELILYEDEKDLDFKKIAQTLKNSGFELLDDEKVFLIEKIKNEIIDLVHWREDPSLNINFSSYIQEKLNVDYHYLSSLFSATEGITIEKYLILQRIERVKELLAYNELSLSQIADQMGYSSLAHLSAQFKKITGFTPSAFRKLTGENRKPLDKIQ